MEHTERWEKERMSGIPRIYIMGSYSTGDIARNVRKAVEMADVISALGACPFIPHLCHLWHLIAPHDYDFWMDYDLQWLGVCNAAFRLPGQSDGAEKEERYCEKMNIPVFHNTVDLMKFIEDWRYSRGY